MNGVHITSISLLIIISVLISISIVGCVLYNVYRNITHTPIGTTSNLDSVINTYDGFMHYLNEIYQGVKITMNFYIFVTGVSALIPNL